MLAQFLIATDFLTTLDYFVYLLILASILFVMTLAWHRRPKPVQIVPVAAHGKSISPREGPIVVHPLEPSTSEPQTESEPPGLQQVEFTPWAPAKVRPNQRFQIRIDIARPRSSKILDSTPIDEELALHTFVTQIYQGSRVGLLLLSQRVTEDDVPIAGENLNVFSPFQALSLTSDDLYISFPAQAPTVAAKCYTRNTVLVTVNNSIIARIFIPICIDPACIDDKELESRDTKPRPTVGLRGGTSYLTRQIENARSQVLPVKSAFVCYEHDNWVPVSIACHPLEVSGVTCHVDVLALAPTTDWRSEVDRLLKSVDMVVLFWSKTIMARASTQDELKMLADELLIREDSKKQLLIDVVFLDEARDLPFWLHQYLRNSKRWEAFERVSLARQSEQEFKKAYWLKSRLEVDK